MFITHRNFKSIDPKIQNAGMIREQLDCVLYNQNRFDVRTTPWEIGEWGENELERFRIKLEKIDRLYFIHHFEDYFGHSFNLICRMDYNGKFVFVELTARCGSTKFGDDDDAQFYGLIFVSTNVNIFIQSIISNKLSMELIRQSLVEDDIELDCGIEFYNKFYDFFKSRYRNIDEFKKSLLNTTRDSLPEILRNNLDDFLKFIDIKYEYDNVL